ncbi:MAG: SAVED domain-containing protein [Calditerrivibrio sp.]|nr:SAVED domain-containing protein [Calditerrivibrio sp.]
MFDLLNNLNDENKNFVRIIIEEGKINEKDLHKFYELFYDKKHEKHPLLKTKLFFSIKKYPDLFDEKLFYQSFGVQLQNLNPFENCRIRYFPITDENNTILSKLYLFEHDIPDFPLTFPNTDTKIKKSLEKLRKIIGKNFLVCFEDNFCGNSFELALAAAFFVKERYADKYSFTGEIKPDKTVSKVDYIEKKRKKSEELKYLLVSPEEIDNISDLSLLNTDTLHLPFIQLFAKLQKDIQRNFKLLSEYTSHEKLLSILKITEEKCSIFSETFVNNSIHDWKPFFDEAFGKIDNLKKSYPEVVIHYLLGTSAFAFPLGVKQTALNSCVLYHFQGDKIYKVMDFTEIDPREIKKKVIKYSLINPEEYIDNGSDELCIAIYLASHNLKNDAKNFANNILKSNFLYISAANSQGSINPEKPEDWINIVRELYSKIDETANNSSKPIKHYHFIFSVPVPIAFALGMAIGDYKTLSIYNFDKSSKGYREVFTTKEI